MAGLLALSVALSGPAGLTAGLPRRTGALQPEREPLGRTAATSLAVVAACDGALAPAAELVAAVASGGVQAAVSNPPRVSNHTRRITVPTYCLSTTTRPRTRRRSRRALGGDDEFDGGDGGDGGWGGDDGWWRGDDDGDEEGPNGPAARLHDLLMLWSLFCGLAFCQVRRRRPGQAAVVARACSDLSIAVFLIPSCFNKLTPCSAPAPHPLAAACRRSTTSAPSPRQWSQHLQHSATAASRRTCCSAPSRPADRRPAGRTAPSRLTPQPFIDGPCKGPRR